MQRDCADVSRPETALEDDCLRDLLRGYRFRVCEEPASIAAALRVRRDVYVGQVGYSIPVPDAYDRRSWLLLAEDTSTGAAVGSMRVTPRHNGRLECEEYFHLPPRLASPRAFELNRFAILPPYRKGRTFLPVVSLGLFKLVHDLLAHVGAHFMVIAARPERIWTYKWMRFQSTGLKAMYDKLGRTEHELLWYDFRRAPVILEGHPFREFFVGAKYEEVVIPRTMPSLGAGMDSSEESLHLARTA
jgi:N-acyl-L-homoserine lactone synthetase